MSRGKAVMYHRVSRRKPALVVPIKRMIIRLLIGHPLPYPTGAEEITTVTDAFLWRLASLPGLDAYIIDGQVTLFRTREQ